MAKIYQTLTHETSPAIIFNMQCIFQSGIWVLKPWQPDVCFILVFDLTKTANSDKNLKRHVYVTKTANSDKKILKDVSMKRATFLPRNYWFCKQMLTSEKLRRSWYKYVYFLKLDMSLCKLANFKSRQGARFKFRQGVKLTTFNYHV